MTTRCWIAGPSTAWWGSWTRIPKLGSPDVEPSGPDGSYQKTTALMYSMGTEVANVLRQSAVFRDGIDEEVTTWQSAGWLKAILMVRAEVIKQVGVLDEYFYTFLSEADWCLRICRAGWKVAYVPDFEIMHIRGAHFVRKEL